MQFFKFLFLGKRRIPSWLPYIVLQMVPSLRLFNLQTTFSIIRSFGVQLGTLLLPSEKGNGTEQKSRGKNSLSYLVTKREPCLYIYIYMNEDENPSTKSTMHVKANVNTPKENQNNQNSRSNEVEDPMLKGLSIANIQLF